MSFHEDAQPMWVTLMCPFHMVGSPRQETPLHDAVVTSLTPTN